MTILLVESISSDIPFIEISCYTTNCLDVFFKASTEQPNGRRLSAVGNTIEQALATLQQFGVN